MTGYSVLYLSDVYEVERKALAKAVSGGRELDFMQGIIAMVSEIEGQILDREADENNAPD